MKPNSIYVITYIYICIFLLCLTFSLSNKIESRLNTEQTPSYTLLKSIRRSNTYYTQGMFFTDDGKNLIESGGQYGQSTLVSMQYPSLILNKVNSLSSSYFAEGTARCGNYVYLLTWKERKIFKFTYPDLTYISSLTMDSRIKEGWGLATLSSTELIASDGSSNIYVLNCSSPSLAVKRIIPITKGGYYLYNINALSFAQGYIWANVYYSRKIYKISPTSGNVVSVYDMTSLVNNEINQGTLTYSNLNAGYVLNGIAYDPVRKIWVLTGKEWGFYYEVVFT